LDRDKLKRILEDVKMGETAIEEALELLKDLPYQDIDFAKLDTHRSLRKGFPEVVFCEGKSHDHLREIIRKLSDNEDFVMITRADEEAFKVIKGVREDAQYFKEARIALIGEIKPCITEEYVLVITAGTSDIPVAEEAYLTARVMGNRVEKLYDIGVAGIHRLFDYREIMWGAGVIVAVAGMEGALPGVVTGIVDCPVIAVPTSVGYGANFQGLSGLLTMLNSCAPGLAVVNIDNGFGAGYIAGMINLKGENR